MSNKYYVIGGIDDVNLKQTFLNYLPKPLSKETKRYLPVLNIQLVFVTFGQIFQMPFKRLESLCNQMGFLQQLDHLKLDNVCKK
jgi:hypothetical protein